MQIAVVDPPPGLLYRAEISATAKNINCVDTAE